MQVFGKIAPWILLGLILALVLVLIGMHEMPRQIDWQRDALLIRADGTSQVVQVRLQGSWKPVWLAHALREFTGTVQIDGVLEETAVAVDFSADRWDAGLLFGGSYLKQGSMWFVLDEAMEQGILLGTDTNTDTHYWVVLNATTMEQATALRDGWGLPELEFGWEP